MDPSSPRRALFMHEGLSFPFRLSLIITVFPSSMCSTVFAEPTFEVKNARWLLVSVSLSFLAAICGFPCSSSDVFWPRSFLRESEEKLSSSV
jgi:hypothetical protein